MTWLVFSYSLLSRLGSGTRVGLWRRLQRLGAVVLKNGLYVLPDREDCREAFQWLAQEVQQAKGDAIVMNVDRFESMSESELIKLFHNACKEKYEQLDQQIAALEKSLHARSQRKNLLLISKKLMKLEQGYEDVTRLDFFDSPYGVHVATRLRHLKQSLSQESPAIKTRPAAALAAYRDRRWVTRPRPHVDRLACAWLIRQFINPTAVIRYSTQPDPDEVRFDMRGAEFGHEGNRCTFETMLLRFGLSDPALQAIAEIVHEIDLRDGRYARPEVAGLDVILKGWLLEKLSDQELESHGVSLFQAMHVALSRRSQEADG